jgi:hypothetical protein
MSQSHLLKPNRNLVFAYIPWSRVILSSYQMQADSVVGQHFFQFLFGDFSLGLLHHISIFSNDLLDYVFFISQY